MGRVINVRLECDYNNFNFHGKGPIVNMRPSKGQDRFLVKRGVADHAEIFDLKQTLLKWDLIDRIRSFNLIQNYYDFSGNAREKW